MSDSMVLSQGGMSPVRIDAPALRWPVAIAVALAVECAIVLLGWPAQRPAAPVEQPVKVMKLVSIADVPGPAEAPPPLPTPPRPAPKPTHTPKPAPVPQPVKPAATPEVAAAAPVADAAPAPAQAVASPAAPSAPATPAPAKPEPGAVRRGLVPLVRVEPEYPPRALASNTEGFVVAHVTIERDGSVSAVKIVKAQPARMFEQAATRALMQWKFSQNDGPVLGEVELRFSLN